MWAEELRAVEGNVGRGRCVCSTIADDAGEEQESSLYRRLLLRRVRCPRVESQKHVERRAAYCYGYVPQSLIASSEKPEGTVATPVQPNDEQIDQCGIRYIGIEQEYDLRLQEDAHGRGNFTTNV